MEKNKKAKKTFLDAQKELRILNKKENFVKIRTAKGVALALTAVTVVSLLGLISEKIGIEITKKALADYTTNRYTYDYGGGACGTCLSSDCCVGCVGGCLL